MAVDAGDFFMAAFQLEVRSGVIEGRGPLPILRFMTGFTFRFRRVRIFMAALAL